MPKPPTIAVIANLDGAYVRGLIAGITSYGHDFGPWAFRLYADALDRDLCRRVRADNVDGILARIHDGSLGRGLARLGVPLVDLMMEHPIQGVPQVRSDGRAVMQCAFSHLVERGLRTIAFLGFSGMRFSDVRRGHLAALCRENSTVVEAGPTERRNDPHTCLVKYAGNLLMREQTIARWVESLAKPVGLVACNDLLAAVALVACRNRGVAVPDEVAVIGVDDDPVYSQVADPPISSVALDTFKVGYQAAATLHGMMEGRLEPPALTDVEPAGVVARRSTDVLAFAAADARRFVRFIRDHAYDGLTVGQMVKRLGVSRRTMERVFVDSVGHSPKEELRRVRLTRARRLLVESDLSLDEVAQGAGFMHAETMRRAFKDEFGLAPGDFRIQNGSKGRAPVRSGRDVTRRRDPKSA